MHLIVISENAIVETALYYLDYGLRSAWVESGEAGLCRIAG
jgi:hypothetical protein